jgi:hypothetical protein
MSIKKNWPSLYLLFFEMSTLKGDVRVNIFHFSNFFFRPYVKKGEYGIEFVCGNVIFQYYCFFFFFVLAEFFKVILG